jgi:hypothetical protein
VERLELVFEVQGMVDVEREGRWKGLSHGLVRGVGDRLREVVIEDPEELLWVI